MFRDIFFKAEKEIYYINDKNKNKRWIFPSGLSYPVFLNLYNSSTYKGIFYKQFVKLIFKLKLQKFFVSGVCKGELNIKYRNILKELNCRSYSVFTGTVGENRKIVIEANNGRYTKYFVKISTTESAKILVQQERKNLEYLEDFNFNTFEVPKVVFSDEETIAISNIKPKRVLKSDKFSEVHFRVLDELYDKTAIKCSLVEIVSMQQAIINIDKLASMSLDMENLLHREIYALKKLLKEITNFLIEKNTLTISFAHCDFTPWNIYITRDKLYVYDWELARHDTPLLFDFFHYIFQQSILVEHKSYKQIKGEINGCLKIEKLGDILNDYEISINEYYGYYLIINISYYSLKYVNQKDLHVQVYWLIDVWNDALSDYLEKKGEVFDK